MSNSNTTPKDAYGYDAMSTYLPIDGIGINALSDSEKYTRGIKENGTGRTRTLGIWMSCPDCRICKKVQEFIPNDYGVELSEEIERKECPDCRSKNYSGFYGRKGYSILSKPYPKDRRQVSGFSNRW